MARRAKLARFHDVGNSISHRIVSGECLSVTFDFYYDPDTMIYYLALEDEAIGQRIADMTEYPCKRWATRKNAKERWWITIGGASPGDKPVTVAQAESIARKLLDAITAVEVTREPILLYRISLTIPAVINLTDGSLTPTRPCGVHEHEADAYEWLTQDGAYGIANGGSVDVLAFPGTLEKAVTPAGAVRLRIASHSVIASEFSMEDWPKPALEAWEWLQRIHADNYLRTLYKYSDSPARWVEEEEFRERMTEQDLHYIPLTPEVVMLFGGVRKQLAEGYARLWRFLKEAAAVEGGLQKALEVQGGLSLLTPGTTEED